MRLTKLTVFLTAIVGFGVLTAGCGSSETRSLADDLNAEKGKPPPTAAQMAKGWAAVAAGHEKAKQESDNWVKAHPDEAAKTNAARAKLGLAPLGSG